MPITTVSDARAASAATLTSVDGIRLLHWPADDGVRAELADAGTPCILLVAQDAAPPEEWDDLEDWVRLPLDPEELQRRARTLRRRARATDRPWFDDDGLLRVGDQWLDLPAGPACGRRGARRAASARWSTPTSSRRCTWRPAGARASRRARR